MKFLQQYILPWLAGVLVCGLLLAAMALLIGGSEHRKGSEPEPVVQTQEPPPAPLVAAEPPPPISSVPELIPVEREKVVRSGDRTFQLTTPARSQATDIATYNALQKNCRDATRNNQSGEYPALQQMACDRFEQFAASTSVANGSPSTPAPVSAKPASASTPTPTPTPSPTPTPQVSSELAPAVPDAECSQLSSEKEAINARMRQGYTEPEGSRLRDRLRVVDNRLWLLHCQLK